MRCRGIMYFDAEENNWKIRIGQQVYEAFNGMCFEVLLKNHYYEACFEEDYNECIVTIEDEVTFALRLVEDYHIRISDKELISELDLPF